jgi:hypothetical protein
VLIVRGTSPATAPVVGNAGMPIPSTQGAGRDWLAARLREAGAEVELLAVYERQLPYGRRNSWIWPGKPPATAACGCSAARKLLPTCNSCCPSSNGTQG